MLKNYIAILLGMFLILSCADQKKPEASLEKENKEITLYTHRHYDTDKAIIAAFEKESGIKVNVVKASADELIQKMESEGKQSPADLLITVDAGRLVRAKEKGLLQKVISTSLQATVPTHLRDGDDHWFGLTKRARVIAYNKKKVKPSALSSYEALTEPQWKGKVLIRTSSNIYNQSLLASIIANNGMDNAEKWAAGLVQNFARVPKGNDRDQVKAVLAGEGDVAIVNTYYIGKLLNSKDAHEVEAGKAVNLFFPNQEGRGTHINVSGIAVAKYAPNKENAIQFIEYLLRKDVQEIFAKANYEYPVNPDAGVSDLLKSWGDFKEDKLSLVKLGEHNRDAVILFDKVGWDNGPGAR